MDNDCPWIFRIIGQFPLGGESCYEPTRTISITFLSHQALLGPRSRPQKTTKPFIIKDFCGAPKGTILELFLENLCRAYNSLTALISLAFSPDLAVVYESLAGDRQDNFRVADHPPTGLVWGHKAFS